MRVVMDTFQPGAIVLQCGAGGSTCFLLWCGRLFVDAWFSISPLRPNVRVVQAVSHAPVYGHPRRATGRCTSFPNTIEAASSSLPTALMAVCWMQHRPAPDADSNTSSSVFCGESCDVGGWSGGAGPDVLSFPPCCLQHEPLAAPPSRPSTFPTEPFLFPNPCRGRLPGKRPAGVLQPVHRRPCRGGSLHEGLPAAAAGHWRCAPACSVSGFKKF